MPMWRSAPPSKVVMNYEAPVTAMIEKVFGSAAEYDLIHSHLEFIPFPLAKRCRTPMLTTLHARLDQLELIPVFQEFADLPLVSVSRHQREHCPGRTGRRRFILVCRIPSTPQYNQGPYLVFLGRVAPEKGLDRSY